MSQGWRGQPYPQSQPVPAPNHPYPRHQTNFQQISPGFIPLVPFITQKPHHFQNINPPRLKLLPAQPIHNPIAQLIPKPNNKPTQALNIIELQTIP